MPYKDISFPMPGSAEFAEVSERQQEILYPVFVIH